jgi:hypothetical protein
MLTELSQASPASPSRLLAKNLASRMSATCSAMSCESLINLTPDFSFWKTRQGCLFQTASDPTSQPQYQTYLGSWPKAVLIVRGCLYPQPTWERRMVGSAGGASLGENWKSPNTRDEAERSQQNSSDEHAAVSHQVKHWQTPTDGDHKNDGRAWVTSTKRQGGATLTVQIDQNENARAQGESLNPDWEETLMGWPIGWTDPTKPCGTFPGFPMGQGYDQFEYEPPRTLPRTQMSGRTARIKMIGNGIVPQCATAAYVRLLAELLDFREGS